jgi:hypothetical protein
MPTKDMHTIRESFGNEIASGVNKFYVARDELRRQPNSEYERHFPSYIDDETRQVLVAQAREQDEKDLKAQAEKKLRATLERYPDEVERRRQKIREELRDLADASPEMLLRVSTASDEDLEEFTSAALATGSKKLTGIAFAEAIRRDNAPLRTRIAAEMGDVFAEWESTPSQEAVEAKVAQQHNLIQQHLS